MAYYSQNDSVIFSETTNSSFIDYTVYSGSSLIFSGRAYKFPSASSIDIDVTDVAHSLVNGPIIDSSNGHIDPSGRMTSITVQGNSSHTGTIIFYNRFDTETPQSSWMANDPISHTIDPRQYLYQSSNLTTIVYKNGSQIASYGSVSKITLSSFGLKTGDKLRMTNSAGTVNYSIRCGASYALYYQNSIGGIDSVTCYGPCTRNTNVERYSVANKLAKNFSNNYMFENEVKATEATIGWTLVTGHLSNEDTKNITDLVMSNHCWLHDLETGNLFAVNIDNSTIEQKTYKKDKMSTSYSINVSLAQTSTIRN